jgi:cobalt-zinc-cadmium efflux system outer membrane protein
MSLSKTMAAAGLAVSLAARAGSTEPEDSLLQGLVEEALARNPDLVSARQALAAAEARPAQAGSLPGPTVSVMYQNDGVAPSLGSREMTMLSVGASQEIPYPGKRGLRRRLAEADARMTALDVERVRLGLIASVKRAYYELRLARGLASLAVDQGKVWREIQETSRVRYASAVGAQQELLRAQVESTRAQALHAQHHAEARARLAELNRLVARPVDTSLDVTPLIALEPESRRREELVAWSESASPELKGVLAAVQRDELALALAGKEFRPDLAVQGAYVNRGGLDPMWQAGVSIALPARGRARAAVTEAAARLAASKARAEGVRLRLEAVVEQRLALMEAAQQIEVTYREGLLPQDQVVVESALAGYRTGQGMQSGVLEPMVALLEDRTDYLRLLAAYAAERTRLDEVSLEPGALEGILMHGRSGLSGMGTSSETR